MLKTKNFATLALEKKCFFKLVCGASLTDIDMIEKLSFLFTLAGAHVIDLAPRADVILACKKGIQKALGRDMPWHVSTPLIMASIQLDKDPHFRKVTVDYNLCDLCGKCIKACPTEAFNINDFKFIAPERKTRELAPEDLSEKQQSVSLPAPPVAAGSNLRKARWACPRDSKFEERRFIYLEERCFGCGMCPGYCHVNALSMIETNPTPEETLKEMIQLRVDSIEFHFGKNYMRIVEIWDKVKNLIKDLNLLSFSVGSELLSEPEIKEASNLCYKLAGRNIILQCDGKPMSGGSNFGNNNDNSSIEVAMVIQKENLPVYLQLSGGTDEHSYKRACNRGVKISGVAIGSYARKLLMPHLKNQRLMSSREDLHNALEIAKRLVNSIGGSNINV